MLYPTERVSTSVRVGVSHIENSAVFYSSVLDTFAAQTLDLTTALGESRFFLDEMLLGSKKVVCASPFKQSQKPLR